ncbi:sodium-coupled monocarboxylate transporter 2, partial [Trichonephila inaurata madagascariensis]
MDIGVFLGVLDMYIGMTLVISTAIGLRFRSKNKKGETSREYLLAGKDMSIFPVIMSITVTMLSGVTILGHPAETYRYGIQLLIICVGIPIGTIITSYVFLPVYFQCDVSTSYEFLEMRYGIIARRAISALSLIQMILFMSVVLYAPALALSAVTDLSLEVSIVVFGLVCSFYCAVGGLRAVIWTDVFQAGLMFLCLILLYIKGVGEAGGVSEIYRKSAESNRLNIFEFREDFVKKPCVCYWDWCFMPSFDTCDPVKDKMHTGVRKYDQIVPYYIISRFGSVPGLTGICIAGIFSGSLSTLSSALNSLSAVTVIDFLKPIYKSRLSETRMVYIAKIL